MNTNIKKTSTKTKIIGIGAFVFTAAFIGLYPLFEQGVTANTIIPANFLIRDEQPRIQLAILLDTSSSMDGLLNQARNQLWQVVNEFANSKKNGMTPLLEVAVYEYGNNNLAADTGYIRQVIPLTQELDKVSEVLFSLTTNGGNEYCGYAINAAAKELSWSNSDEDIKTIFIAGNEQFTQGPIAFKTAIAAAKEKGIVVNTIHAGPHDAGITLGWRDGAVLAGGDYMSIDHNREVVYINAPQDSRLAELNTKLNETYLPYGAEGKHKSDRQIAEDGNSRGVAAGMMSKRTLSKASPMYNNSSWDLVDAFEKGLVELEDIKNTELPEVMQDMGMEAQSKYVNAKAEDRKQLQEDIKTLGQERKKYVAEQKKNQAQVSTIDTAIVESVRKQGEEKNYEF